jgi:adenylate cyclase
MARARPRPGIEHWPQRPGPVLDWLIGDGRQAGDGAALLQGLCTRLLAAGIPLARVSFNLRLLHPQLMGMGFYWHRGETEIHITRATHGTELTDTFLKSPMRVLFEGASAVRQRLDLPGARLDFPLLEELREQGLTDYVALPITFSDGRMHGTTWACDRPGGFTSDDLAQIYDLLPVWGLLLEIHFSRLLTITLLDTYVGHHAGERILSGQIRRGSGETVEAAIWFCDLRGFTELSEARPREELLATLNQFFDAMAEPVERHGGEILKFIGDAMLAVFPLAEPQACRRAVEAAIEAAGIMAALNTELARNGEPLLDYAIALHAGEVMYGNIGASNRLDFTVVGPAVNLASRLERLCRALGPKILVSDAFACGCASVRFRSLGRHRLPGVAREVEVLTPQETP